MEVFRSAYAKEAAAKQRLLFAFAAEVQDDQMGLHLQVGDNAVKILFTAFSKPLTRWRAAFPDWKTDP